uniref:Small ribosomal subunit protein mS41 SAM domain-containing protein n=1 Tax=Populus trichocarpa TaxID=3694 RepID=A0A2K1XZ10_POPTR
MAMAWRQIITNTKRAVSIPTQQAISTPGFSRFFSKSSSRYIVKVGIPEFLNGIGKGVEAHVAKLESEIGDFHKLLVTRTLKLKKLGIPCQQVGAVEA